MVDRCGDTGQWTSCSWLRRKRRVRRPRSAPRCAEAVVQSTLLTHESCSCGPPPVACPSGIAQQTSQPAGIALLGAAVEQQREPLATLTLLLRLCRDEHRQLWEQAHDPTSREYVQGVVAGVRDLLTRGDGEEVDPLLRHALVLALQAAEQSRVALVAHALAQLLDDRFCSTFPDALQRRSPYQPGVGDPVPLSTVDLRGVLDMRPTAPPWRLAHRLDETRHVRLAGEWAARYRVVFDYGV